MEPERIQELFGERRDNLRVAHAQMGEVADIYSGKAHLVTSELWGASEKPAVPNLTLVAINQGALRVASTPPLPLYVPSKLTKGAEDAARTKLSVTLGWFKANAYARKTRRRARHLLGYGVSPVLVVPDAERRIPSWRVFGPRSVFPAATLDPDDMCPSDVIVTFDRSWSWLKYAYPDQHARVFKGENYRPDMRCTLLEYWSAEEQVLMVLGASRPYEDATWTDWGQSRAEVLERIPNRAECCPLVMPSRIALEGAQGIVDQNVGLHQRQARMMAMEEIAIQRSIFVETYIESDGMSIPRFEAADGRTGKVGKVAGGRIKEVRPDPGILAFQAVDRGERAMRVQGGVPADVTGESASNVRTGRRGEAILSATVDLADQEHQDLLAESIEHELRRAIAIDKAWFNTSKPVFFSAKASKDAKTYTPRDLWDTDDVSVRYSQPGSDINGLVIGGGQRVGLGTMSKRQFMRIDPLVEDAEQMADEITVEALDTAILSAIQQLVATGQITLPDVARIKQLVKSDRMDLEDAVAKVQREAQERQAPDVDPVSPGAPEAQPGIADPGAGAEAGTVETPQGVAGLTSLLGALRLGQRQSPQEAAFNASGAA